MSENQASDGPMDVSTKAATETSNPSKKNGNNSNDNPSRQSIVEALRIRNPGLIAQLESGSATATNTHALAMFGATVGSTMQNEIKNQIIYPLQYSHLYLSSNKTKLVLLYGPP